jgi:hypothetical protein
MKSWHRLPLPKAALVLMAPLFIAAHLLALYLPWAGVLPIVAASGTVGLVLIKHLGLLTPWWLSRRQKSREDDA